MKPRLCKRCAKREPGCTASTCHKALDAYRRGYAAACRKALSIAEARDISAAEVDFDRFTGARNDDHAFVLMKILEHAEAVAWQGGGR